MCFGVRAALETARAMPQPQQVTIYGELVHNQVVLDQLNRAGFHHQAESAREQLPVSRQVLITAHGISDWRKSQLVSAGRELIDTTCPLVTRVHRAAQQLSAEGFYVLVIGRRGHVEVQGIIEDLADCQVIEQPEDVRAFTAERLGIVVQTTVPTAKARELY